MIALNVAKAINILLKTERKNSDIYMSIEGKLYEIKQMYYVSGAAVILSNRKIKRKTKINKQ